MSEQRLACVDLDDQFGRVYRVRDETGGRARTRRNPDPWGREIRCRYGMIYPMGPRELAAYSDRRLLRNRLLEIPGVTRHQVGDREVTVTFPLDSKAQGRVFALLRPKRRRQLSPETRARLAEQLTRSRLVPV